MTWRHLIIGLIGFASLSLASEARAQIPYRYTPPAGPTLPNQLNYFRRDVGVLDPYNAFVQPQRQLNYQLQSMVQRDQADTRATQRQLERIREIRESTAAPTGVAAGFMNYSHYYRLPSGGAARTRTR